MESGAPVSSFSNEEMQWIFLWVSEYGSGFYSRLATAALHADPINKARILQCFPELKNFYVESSFQRRVSR